MENEIDDVTRKRKLRKGHTSDKSLQLDKNAICDHFLRTVRGEYGARNCAKREKLNSNNWNFVGGGWDGILNLYPH